MGEYIKGDKEMAEELNTYFGSDFTKEDTNQIPTFLKDARFCGWLVHRAGSLFRRRFITLLGNIISATYIDVTQQGNEKSAEKRRNNEPA
eukprot:g15864.t1